MESVSRLAVMTNCSPSHQPTPAITTTCTIQLYETSDAGLKWAIEITAGSTTTIMIIYMLLIYVSRRFVVATVNNRKFQVNFYQTKTAVYAVITLHHITLVYLSSASAVSLMR